jgi:predicted nuclease of predicted toxin-antitoxin system
VKLLVDMNLPPQWAEILRQAGWEAVHWSSVGNPRATDLEIFAYAKHSGYVVFTHDLDFGTLLALTSASSPSVFQVRTQDVSPKHLAPIVVPALRQFASQLDSGAIVTVDESRLRARILPIGKRES